MFGRAAITLGIRPHSSLLVFCSVQCGNRQLFSTMHLHTVSYCDTLRQRQAGSTCVADSQISEARETTEDAWSQSCSQSVLVHPQPLQRRQPIKHSSRQTPQSVVVQIPASSITYSANDNTNGTTQYQ